MEKQESTTPSLRDEADPTVNAEAIPPELPNAASPLPDLDQRRERPVASAAWVVPVVGALILLLIALAYALYVGKLGHTL
jgi:hypothetical protein